MHHFTLAHREAGYQRPVAHHGPFCSPLLSRAMTPPALDRASGRVSFGYGGEVADRMC